MQSGFDRVDGDVQLYGRFPMGEPAQVEEVNGLALAAWEPVNRSPDPGTKLCGFDYFVGRFHRPKTVCQVRRRPRLRQCRPKDLSGLVQGDAAEPSPKPIGMDELGKAQPGNQRRLLDGIAACFRVSEQPSAQTLS
jgi:hypothetical protein